MSTTAKTATGILNVLFLAMKNRIVLLATAPIFAG
jgi:hypothetical protein